MNILAIDTSCDETAAAVTQNVQATSNMVWSQASLHSAFGGVKPGLAQRQHEQRIDWIIQKALGKKHKNLKNIDAIAITTGPGLAIALGVGINSAKNLAKKYKKPLITINHIEAHLLSPFIQPKNSNKKIDVSFPALGLILSGGTTLICLVESIGKYKILARTSDDALGEALDKAARLLGFGYPGAHILEKYAKEGDVNSYKLPTPLIQDKIKNRFSYSGLKTAFVRLHDSLDSIDKKGISNLSAAFQNKAFEHVINVLEYQINNHKKVKDLLFGGGVANNIELRKRLRKLCKKHKLTLHIPYSKKLMSDNAAMVGVCAYLKNENFDAKDPNSKYLNYESIDRTPKLSI